MQHRHSRQWPARSASSTSDADIASCDRPRARAAARPAEVRSRMRLSSNSASAAGTGRVDRAATPPRYPRTEGARTGRRVTVVRSWHGRRSRSRSASTARPSARRSANRGPDRSSRPSNTTREIYRASSLQEQVNLDLLWGIGSAIHVDWCPGFASGGRPCTSGQTCPVLPEETCSDQRTSMHRTRSRRRGCL